MNIEADRSDEAIEKKYPDVNVIKELPQMKVACFSFFGEEPENHAFAEIKRWAETHGLSFHESSDHRIFGYNNPDPMSLEEMYGYEVCVTVSKEIYDSLEDAPAYGRKETFDKVRRRILPGGQYATVLIKHLSDSADIGCEIMAGWKRIREWLDESRYVWDNRPYLEEHLGFDENDDHTGGVELYLPVKKLPCGSDGMIGDVLPETISETAVASFRVSGLDDMDKTSEKAWGKIISWAKMNGIDSGKHRILEFNRGFDETAEVFQEIMITVPDDFVSDDPEIVIKRFPGGRYMTVMTDMQNLMQVWGAMEQWHKHTHTIAGTHQWVEEWLLDDWNFPPKAVKVFYPVR